MAHADITLLLTKSITLTLDYAWLSSVYPYTVGAENLPHHIAHALGELFYRLCR